MTTTTASRPLVLIPCGSTKRSTASAASDVYTSSTFRMALAAARSIVAPYGCGDDGIRIVSARHGLLALDTIVEPYDTTIGDTDAVTPATIAAQADEQGVAGHPSPIMLLPRRYRDLVETSGAWDVDTMIDGYVGGLDTEGIGRMRGTCAHVVAAEPTRKRALARTSTQEEAR